MEACPDDAGVVKDQAIAAPQVLRQIAEDVDGHGMIRALEHQQPGFIAPFAGLLRNKLFRKRIIEI